MSRLNAGGGGSGNPRGPGYISSSRSFPELSRSAVGGGGSGSGSPAGLQHHPHHGGVVGGPGHLLGHPLLPPQLPHHAHPTYPSGLHRARSRAAFRGLSPHFPLGQALQQQQPPPPPQQQPQHHQHLQQQQQQQQQQHQQQLLQLQHTGGSGLLSHSLSHQSQLSLHRPDHGSTWQSRGGPASRATPPLPSSSSLEHLQPPQQQHHSALSGSSLGHPHHHHHPSGGWDDAVPSRGPEPAVLEALDYLNLASRSGRIYMPQQGSDRELLERVLQHEGCVFCLFRNSSPGMRSPADRQLVALRCRVTQCIHAAHVACVLECKRAAAASHSAGVPERNLDRMLCRAPHLTSTCSMVTVDDLLLQDWLRLQDPSLGGWISASWGAEIKVSHLLSGYQDMKCALHSSGLFYDPSAQRVSVFHSFLTSLPQLLPEIQRQPSLAAASWAAHLPEFALQRGLLQFRLDLKPRLPSDPPAPSSAAAITAAAAGGLDPGSEERFSMVGSPDGHTARVAVERLPPGEDTPRSHAHSTVLRVQELDAQRQRTAGLQSLAVSAGLAVNFDLVGVSPAHGGITQWCFVDPNTSHVLRLLVWSADRLSQRGNLLLALSYSMPAKGCVVRCGGGSPAISADDAPAQQPPHHSHQPQQAHQRYPPLLPPNQLQQQPPPQLPSSQLENPAAPGGGGGLLANPWSAGIPGDTPLRALQPSMSRSSLEAERWGTGFASSASVWAPPAGNSPVALGASLMDLAPPDLAASWPSSASSSSSPADSPQPAVAAGVAAASELPLGAAGREDRPSAVSSANPSPRFAATLGGVFDFPAEEDDDGGAGPEEAAADRLVLTERRRPSIPSPVGPIAAAIPSSHTPPPQPPMTAHPQQPPAALLPSLPLVGGPDDTPVAPEAVVGVSVDQLRSPEGSRYVQRRLEEFAADSPLDPGCQLYVRCFLQMVEPFAAQMMTDSFAHFAVEKWLHICMGEELMRLLQALSPSLLSVACHKHGSFSVQALVSAVARVRIPRLTSLLLQSLANKGRDDPGPGSLLTLACHSSGHYALLRVLQHFSGHNDEAEEETLFIDRMCAQHCMRVATDHFGLRVLKAVLYARPAHQLAELLEQLRHLALDLVQHQFGNYAVQAALEVAPTETRAQLQATLQGSYQHLSRSKFSSNVVERCLRLPVDGDDVAQRWRSQIVAELIQQPGVADVLRDRYGNYVLQTAVSIASPSELLQIENAIGSYLPTLRENVQVKWCAILTAARDKYNISGGPAVVTASPLKLRAMALQHHHPVPPLHHQPQLMMPPIPQQQLPPGAPAPSHLLLMQQAPPALPRRG